MGGLFKGPKVSKPKAVQVDKAAEQSQADKDRAAADEEDKRRRAGIASNILFGTSDNAQQQAAVQKKTLLGQ